MFAELTESQIAIVGESIRALASSPVKRFG
jgi:hypothetical protein